MIRNFGIGLVVVIALVVGVYALVYHYLIAPTPRFVPPRVVTIKKGESMTAAARALGEKGVVRSATAFAVYAEMAGQATLIKPGDYQFHGGENAAAVLRHLVKGDFMVFTITVVEGMTMHQVGEELAAAGLVCGNTFDRAARAGPLVRALGLGPLGAEGFLFPATYRFSPNASVNQILKAMIGRFFENLTPGMEQRLFQLGLSVPQMVTLASMVEKEARVAGERRLIASVFYNRLALRMPLQSDPTAQYNPAGESRRAVAAVRTPSAFNTYDFTGLPPGPIASPGLSSIEAVLYPAHTDYLYFVARDDGTHIFSQTFKQHQRAIEQLKKMAANRAMPSEPSHRGSPAVAPHA
ncbi:MAG: endolytic transglycosylase MltG [Candidatus Binataceae bacterium]